jgi:hypothetical protein
MIVVDRLAVLARRHDRRLVQELGELRAREAARSRGDGVEIHCICERLCGAVHGEDRSTTVLGR